jgi:putative Holliday junction resolvase
MPLFNLTELIKTLPSQARLIGLDPGARRIGIALSDVNRRLASPYSTILRGKLAHNAAEIKAIAEAEGAAGLVIGLPLGIEGELGPAAQSVRDWAHAISHATGLPATMWDESLTTADLHDVLIHDAGMTRARRAAVIDKMAAAKILQMALDAHQSVSLIASLKPPTAF